MNKTNTNDWETEFDDEWPEAYLRIVAPGNNFRAGKEIKDFIRTQISLAEARGAERVIEEINEIENSQITTTLEEWKMYKRIRNRLRDKFLTK